ncbi:hypothetical protein Emed_006425 [Eimeria media]
MAPAFSLCSPCDAFTTFRSFWPALPPLLARLNPSSPKATLEHPIAVFVFVSFQQAAARRTGGVLPVVSVFAELRGATAEILQAWRLLELTYCFVGGRGEAQDEEVSLWLQEDDPSGSPPMLLVLLLLTLLREDIDKLFAADALNLSDVAERHVLQRTLVEVHHSFPMHASPPLKFGSGSSGVGAAARWVESPVVRHRCCLSQGFSHLRCVIVELRPLDASGRPLGPTTRAGVVADQPELQALDL